MPEKTVSIPTLAERSLGEKALRSFERRLEAGKQLSYASYVLGFRDGWREETNRPYFCAFCTFECQGETDALTLALITEHVMSCPYHPLNVRIRDLEAQLAVESAGPESEPGTI